MVWFFHLKLSLKLIKNTHHCHPWVTYRFVCTYFFSYAPLLSHTPTTKKTPTSVHPHGQLHSRRGGHGALTRPWLPPESPSTLRTADSSAPVLPTEHHQPNEQACPSFYRRDPPRGAESSDDDELGRVIMELGSAMGWSRPPSPIRAAEELGRAMRKKRQRSFLSYFPSWEAALGR
jgi:hypothetical protein